MDKLSDRALRDYVSGNLDAGMSRVIADSAVWDHELRARIQAFRAEAAKLAEASQHGPLSPASSAHGSPARRLGPGPILGAGFVFGLLAYHLSSGFLATSTASSQLPLGLSAGLIDGRNPLHTALETRDDSDDLAFAGKAGSIRPLSTFRIAGPRYCREFDVLFRAGAAYSGLACRGPKAAWRLEILVPSRRGASSGDSYAPASNSGRRHDGRGRCGAQNRAIVGGGGSSKTDPIEMALTMTAWQSGEGRAGIA